MVRLDRLAMFVAVWLLPLAACSGASNPSPVPASTSPSAPATQAAASPSASAASVGTHTFTVAYPSAYGFSDAPLRAAIASLNASGWNITETELNASELGYQGVVSGQFQFTSGATVAGMVAAQQQKASEGASKVRMVADRSGNEWVFAATKAISKCTDLNGKAVAIFSAGAVSTAMVKAWVNENCPGTNPTYQIFAGESTARLAALLAGKIDATPLELGDYITLLKQGADKYGALVNFSTALPNLDTAAITTNADFIAANPDTVKDFVTAVIQQFRKVNADPTYLEQIVNQYVPGLPADSVTTSAQQYVKLKLFDVNGGLTDQRVQYSIDFFTKIGNLKPGLTEADVADLTELNAALDELGRQ